MQDIDIERPIIGIKARRYFHISIVFVKVLVHGDMHSFMHFYGVNQMPFNLSKRDIDVSSMPHLRRYRDFDSSKIISKFRPFHQSCCEYYDSGSMSERQIDSWTKVIKVAEKIHDKKVAKDRYGKRV